MQQFPHIFIIVVVIFVKTWSRKPIDVLDYNKNNDNNIDVKENPIFLIRNATKSETALNLPTPCVHRNPFLVEKTALANDTEKH